MDDNEGENQRNGREKKRRIARGMRRTNGERDGWYYILESKQAEDLDREILQGVHLTATQSVSVQSKKGRGRERSS